MMIRIHGGQIIVVALGVALLSAVSFFPPWHCEIPMTGTPNCYLNRQLRWDFSGNLTNPPSMGVVDAQIDFARLITAWFAIIAMTTFCFLFVGYVARRRCRTTVSD